MAVTWKLYLGEKTLEKNTIRTWKKVFHSSGRFVAVLLRHFHRRRIFRAHLELVERESNVGFYLSKPLNNIFGAKKFINI